MGVEAKLDTNWKSLFFLPFAIIDDDDDDKVPLLTCRRRRRRRRS
jgi:hypothetical protein